MSPANVVAIFIAVMSCTTARRVMVWAQPPNSPHCSAAGVVPITFNSSNQNPVLSDTCGTWLLFNNLFGVTPFVDFCKVTGNVCNENGETARDCKPIA